MAFFDFNAAVGRGAHPAGGAFETGEALRAELSRLGISEALVCHRLAAEADVVKGNQLLLECIDGCPGLYPCWVMAPPALGDLPDPNAWVGEAVACGVRAVRMMPAHSLYTLADWCVGPVVDALHEAGLPLLLDFGTHHWSQRVIPWPDIKRLCERRPELAVVIVGPTVGATRDAVALLRRFPNLHIEMHRFAVPDGYQLLAREGLGGQLVFGTGLPTAAGECATYQCRCSGLEPAEQEAVASGNARRLLGLERPQAAIGSAASGDGAPALPGVVIDAHAHFGSWERTISTVKEPEDIIASMDRCGVDVLIGSSFSSIHGEMEAGNRETADIIRGHPGRLYGFCGVNPHLTDRIQDELARCFEGDAAFVGLKFHCGLHAADLDHPGYVPALTYANEHALPVLVHGGGAGWKSVAAGFPRAPMIMAHACGWDGVSTAGRETHAIARDSDNVYVDVAGSAAHRGALRALVDLVGAGKVLFGSDFPMFDLGYELGRVASSELDEAERAAVCGGNALRVFGRLPRDAAHLNGRAGG
ncbi:MAG: amidohydrolase family protein [Candidatus Hydrogenedentes bacterium]|nr:amidohydrolase family protein [Candidatus Hydrogenedentota bacterium]